MMSAPNMLSTCPLPTFTLVFHAPMSSWSSLSSKSPANRFCFPGLGSENLVPRMSFLRFADRCSFCLPLESTDAATRCSASDPHRAQKS